MTGYGKSVLQLPTKKVTVEVKSLNSKPTSRTSALMLPRKELSVRKLLPSPYKSKVDFLIFDMIVKPQQQKQRSGNRVYSTIKTLVHTASSDDIELLRMAVKMPDTKNRTKNTKTIGRTYKYSN